MLEERIRQFIVNGCYSDSLRYNEYLKAKSKNNRQGDLEGQWSYITELMIITIKSLIPSNSLVGAIVDYERFEKEFRLWYMYRHGSNNSLTNALLNQSSEVYWKEADDSVYSRIIPLVACNQEWSVIKAEIIKNVLRTSGNISLLIEVIGLARLLMEILPGEMGYEKVLESVKDEIIKFSQKDFIEEYSHVFLFPLGTYPQNYTIDFERKRIELLNTFNGYYNGNEFSIIKLSLDILKHKEKSYDKINELLDSGSSVGRTNINNNFFIRGLSRVVCGINDIVEFKDKNFINSLGGYLYKIRKSRISPEILRVDNYHMPDIFAFNEGEEFNHSLLNRCKVLKKEIVNGYLISYVQTKTGRYRFFRKNKQD